MKTAVSSARNADIRSANYKNYIEHFGRIEFEILKPWASAPRPSKVTTIKGTFYYKGSPTSSYRHYRTFYIGSNKDHVETLIMKFIVGELQLRHRHNNK